MKQQHTAAMSANIDTNTVHDAILADIDTNTVNDAMHDVIYFIIYIYIYAIHRPGELVLAQRGSGPAWCAGFVAANIGSGR
jgi:hypothetical protein